MAPLLRKDVETYADLLKANKGSKRKKIFVLVYGFLIVCILVSAGWWALTQDEVQNLRAPPLSVQVQVRAELLPAGWLSRDSLSPSLSLSLSPRPCGHSAFCTRNMLAVGRNPTGGALLARW